MRARRLGKLIAAAFAASVLAAQAEDSPADIATLLAQSRRFSDLVDDTKNEAAARSAAEKALDYARRAVALAPSNAKAHLSVAVSYGKMTDFVGNRQKIGYSRLVRDEAMKSLELDPNDDYAWHVLGRWHEGVANVNGVLRALAKVAYGGLPPASNDEAVRCLRKAIDLAPRRIIHRSELARIFTAMGQREAAAEQWRQVLALPVSDHGDDKDKAEARAALGAK